MPKLLKKKVSDEKFRLSNEELLDGWISLFDGETLYGWRNESNADWRVENNAILVEKGKPGLLRTSAQFDNFLLRVEFRAPAKTNSGIFIRTSPNPIDPASDCYEINIAEPSVSPFPTGSIVKRVKANDADRDKNEKKNRKRCNRSA